MAHTYRSDVKVGSRYRDSGSSGFEGKCVGITFYEHGCERPILKGMNRNGEVVEYAFDAPDLELVKANGETRPVTLVERKTGGPHDAKAPSRR